MTGCRLPGVRRPLAYQCYPKQSLGGGENRLNVVLLSW
jgi:hypothetical protein